MPTSNPATIAIPISRPTFGDEGTSEATAALTTWPPLEDWAVTSWIWLSCDFRADCCWYRPVSCDWRLLSDPTSTLDVCESCDWTASICVCKSLI